MRKGLFGILRPLPRGCDAARRGVVASEFAAIATPLFLLFMGTVELSMMFGAQQLLENAAYNTSRIAKTGYIATGQTQATTVMQVFNSELQSYGSLINTNCSAGACATMTEVDYNSFTSAGTGGGTTTGYGTQQQIVVYTVTYPWALFTPILSSLMGSNGIVNLTATIVVRNEPYG
jgi:Flp pilus assembly protein TadG